MNKIKLNTKNAKNAKKAFALILAAAMAASVVIPAFAESAPVDGKITLANDLVGGNTVGTAEGITNSKGEVIEKTDVFNADISSGSVTLDRVTPNQTIYIYLGPNDAGYTTGLLQSDGSASGRAAMSADLGNANRFSMSVAKSGDGKKLIKSVSVVADKYIESVDGGKRGTFLVVTLGSDNTTEDIAAKLDITFRAKRDFDDSRYPTDTGATYVSGDYATLSVDLWINNNAIENNGYAEMNKDVYFEVEESSDNTFVWGDDMAMLQFYGNSSKNFYAKLSNDVDFDVYKEYGDPVNAELFFYNFVSNPAVPSSSKATLVLGIPWDVNGSYVPTPADCFIYQLVDGEWTDVTADFVYSDSNWEIPGWATKTRQLGTYMISDKELDIGAAAIEDTDDISIGDLEDLFAALSGVDPETSNADTESPKDTDVPADVKIPANTGR